MATRKADIKRIVFTSYYLLLRVWHIVCEEKKLLDKLMDKPMDFAEHNAIKKIFATIISMSLWILAIMGVLVCLWLFIWLVGIFKTPFHP